MDGDGPHYSCMPPGTMVAASGSQRRFACSIITEKATTLVLQGFTASPQPYVAIDAIAR